MKKLLCIMLAITGLALTTPAYAQNFSVSLRNWDLLVYSVEAEYHPMPHLGIVAGVGVEVLSFTNFGVVGGLSYFALPDHTGLYGGGRLMYAFNLNPYPFSFFGLFTTGGYRWLVDQNTQLDIEIGLLWPIFPRPGGVLGTFPLISLGFGGRF